MGRVGHPDPALLFIGTLYADKSILQDTHELLVRNFGEILLTSPSMPWDYSTYYHDEIGYPLLRRFHFFKTLITPACLTDIKLKTNDIEDILSLEGRRRINLDPGYLTLSQIVLASTKNYSHRIYLGKGIFGEVTLIYRNKTYKPHLFTYRDYQDNTYIELFLNARELLKKMSC